MDWFWNEGFKQRFEARTQTELLRFHFKKIRIRSVFESIAKIGQTQEPQRVPEIIRMSYTKADPARVWNPVVLFGKVFFEERIADDTWKRDIHDAPRMHMPDFGFSELELAASEAVRVNRDASPQRYPVDEIFH